MATTSRWGLHQHPATGGVTSGSRHEKAGARISADLCLCPARAHWRHLRESLRERGLVTWRGQGQAWRGRPHYVRYSRCSASDGPSPPSYSKRHPRPPPPSEPRQDAPRTDRKKEAHRHALHLERLGPRKRAKMLAGPAGSRAWKRARRKVAKVAESISEVVDAAAAAVALPTLAPLSSEAAQAFARVSGQGPSSWDAMATEGDRLRDSGSSAASALAAFLELDGSRLPSPDGGSFFTSPHQFTASHALHLEDKPPGALGLSDDSQADEAANDVWGEAARMALPVLGLAAATVVGTLFTRRAVLPRVLPRMAMRALAYPALFLQTGILASEQGAERARQAALWSLPPALLVSSCFMGWRVAAASAAAFLTAQLVNVNVSERLPRASHWWQVVLVAAAAASVVDAVVFSRISSRAVHGLALAMALTGDFGEIGERRRSSSVRPALKKQSAIEMEGEVQKALPNAMFQVALDNGCQVLAHISGKIRRNRIEIFQGDRVKVEISPYDLTRGRITHRNRRAGQGPATPGGPTPPGGNPVPA